ncbi:hypothetical protein IQ266_11085 [filamentous cyanobacterium LEGE 11480]|uniref:Uncharacterized protein n=1 Tax=Romeriopsis navalis LEGE 11480 TaxID=2777977 RepID=A0A928Z4I6_9CYAN|nr:hypothetical protein [Romeriopsis navalis]MBE9030275.1 hypothetical protein [Romeriopsis navalis LEGE 11480]
MTKFMQPYISPGCHFIDRLESAAVLRQTCDITYKNTNGERIKTQSKIIDVHTTDGADWCKLTDGMIVRLDQIIAFNEIRSTDSDWIDISQSTSAK